MLLNLHRRRSDPLAKKNGLWSFRAGSNRKAMGLLVAQRAISPGSRKMAGEGLFFFFFFSSTFFHCLDVFFFFPSCCILGVVSCLAVAQLLSPLTTGPSQLQRGDTSWPKAWSRSWIEALAPKEYHLPLPGVARCSDGSDMGKPMTISPNFASWLGRWCAAAHRAAGGVSGWADHDAR